MIHSVYGSKNKYFSLLVQYKMQSYDKIFFRFDIFDVSEGDKFENIVDYFYIRNELLSSIRLQSSEEE